MEEVRIRTQGLQPGKFTHGSAGAKGNAESPWFGLGPGSCPSFGKQAAQLTPGGRKISFFPPNYTCRMPLGEGLSRRLKLPTALCPSSFLMGTASTRGRTLPLSVFLSAFHKYKPSVDLKYHRPQPGREQRNAVRAREQERE